MGLSRILLFLIANGLFSACVARTATPSSVTESTPVAIVSTSPSPTTSLADPRIISFSVSPNPVERGQDITVSWQVEGASQATLWPLIYDSKLGRWYRQPDPISAGSNSGAHRLAVPGDANQTLRFEIEAKNTTGDSVTATSDEVQFVCHALFFKNDNAPWCPNAPQITSAAFQAFAGVYMIWRADTGQVILLRLATPDSPPDWFVFFPTDEVTSRDIPAGKFTPGEHFQRAWASLPEHWSSLGGAVAPEQIYTLTTQLSLSRGDTLSQNDDLYLTWPTGEIAHLRVYLAAPNHANGPAWSFLGPDQPPMLPTAVPSKAPPAINPTPENNPTAGLTITPGPLTLPAGTSGRINVTMNECDQQAATFQAPNLPFGITAEFITTATPCEATMVLTADVSITPGDYVIEVTRLSSAGQTVTGQVRLQVSACTELQLGEFTTYIQSNLIPLITASKPSIEHGLLVPLQFCGNRSITVDLLAVTSEAGTRMTVPPRFYLYRSWVWPAPDSIRAHAAMRWTMNVAVPRVDNNGWQLTANVPAGMYLLVFERDAYDSSTDPKDIPASVTYRVSEDVR